MLDKRLQWAARHTIERGLSLTYALIKDDRLLLLCIQIRLVAALLLLEIVKRLLIGWLIWNIGLSIPFALVR